MINSFSIFSKAVSKTDLKNACSDIIKLDEDFNFFAHIGIGLIFDRIIHYSNFLIDLSNQILKKLSRRLSDRQLQINQIFIKIEKLNRIFYELISSAFDENEIDEDESNDEEEEDENTFIKRIFDSNLALQKSFEEVSQIISESTKDPKLLKNLEEKIKIITCKYNSISNDVKKYQKLQYEIYDDLDTDPEKKLILMKVIQLSILFDDLILKFHCFSLDKSFSKFFEDQESSAKIFEKLNGINERIETIPYDNPIKSASEAIEIYIEFEPIIEFINNIFEESDINANGILNEKGYQSLVEFANAITNSLYSINEIEAFSLRPEINKIIKSLWSNYKNDSPYEDFISIALNLLNLYLPKLKYSTEINSSRQYLQSAFNSLTCYLKEKCVDRDSSSFGLIITIRVISQIFSNSELSEEFLSDLYMAVSKIMLTFIEDCKKCVGDFMSIVDQNLEFFKDDALNEANYFYTAIIGIDERDIKISSDQFISMQQQFYDFYSSSYQSFEQLSASCSKEDVKSALEAKSGEILALGTRYSNWIHQFYHILYSMAHFRSKLVMNILSFPVFLLDPPFYNEQAENDESESYSENDEEEEEEHEKPKSENRKLFRLFAKSVCKIQNRFEQTPQFLLGDIGDIFKMMKSVAKISNNFQKFIEFIIEIADSPFYPIYFYTATGLSQVLSRKLPSYLLSIFSLPNFDDRSYFFCSIKASLSYSIQILKENRDTIEKEKGISPIFISPSFFHVLSSIYISESGSNKEISQLIVSDLSKIYKNFGELWQAAIEYTRSSDDEEEDEDEDDEEKANSLFSSNLDSIFELLNSCLKQFDQYNQLLIPFKVPKSVLEIRQYQHIISLIHNEQVTQFAQFLLNKLYRLGNENSSNFLNEWFRQVLSYYNKFNSHSHFKMKPIEKQLNTIEKLMLSENEKQSVKNYESFIGHLAKASIFIAHNEGNFLSGICNISEKHRNVILLAVKYFTFRPVSAETGFSLDDSIMLNELFLNMYNYLCQIFYCMKLYGLSEFGACKELLTSYKSVIRTLEYISKSQKKKSKGSKNLNVPLFLKQLNELNSYELIVKEKENLDDKSSIETSDYIDFVIKNHCRYNQVYYKEFAEEFKKKDIEENGENESKMLNSCIAKYTQLSPIQSELLETTKKEELQSLANSQALQFNNAVLNYLLTNKNVLKAIIDDNSDHSLLAKKIEMKDCLNDSYLAINLVLIYSIYYMKSCNSSFDGQIVQGFSDAQLEFIKLVALLNKVSATKPSSDLYSDDSFYPKAMQMIKAIDALITKTIQLVFAHKSEKEENVKRSDDESEEENSKETVEVVSDDDDNENKELKSEEKNDLKPEKLKSSFFDLLADMIFNISKLNELASAVFTTEMYEKEDNRKLRQNLIDCLNSSLPELKKLIDQLAENSLLPPGVSSSFYGAFESSLQQFIESTASIHFDVNSKYFEQTILVSSKSKKSKKDAKKATKKSHKHKKDVKEETESNNDNNNNEDNEEISDGKKTADENDENSGNGENDESDSANLEDSTFKHLNQLSGLFSPQLRIFNAVSSLVRELVKKKDDGPAQTVQIASRILSDNRFPSPPNLLKSFFLSFDIDPYVGYKRQNQNSTSENEEQNLTLEETETMTAQQKHTRRYRIALKQLENSYSNLSNALNKFRETTEKNAASPDELMQVSEELKRLADKYSEKVLQITYFTKKNRGLQVEQLVELYNFVNSVNELQTTMKEKMVKGDQSIDEVTSATTNQNKIIETTVKQAKQYSTQFYNNDDENEEEDDDFVKENEVLNKLNESHNKIKLMVKDLNSIVDEEMNQSDPSDLNNSIGLIMNSVSNIIKRAKDLTKYRILHAKREELRKNPVIVDSKGNITRRTSIKDINIKLDNEEGLIKTAEDLQEASKKILVCYESKNQQKSTKSIFGVIKTSSSQSDYLTIISVNAVKLAIISLITQVLYIGGDPDQIMNKEVNQLTDLLNAIIDKSEKACLQKVVQDYENNNPVQLLKATNEVGERIIPIINMYNFNSNLNSLRAVFELRKSELEKFDSE